MPRPFFRGDAVEVRISGPARGVWVPASIEMVTRLGRLGGERWALCQGFDVHSTVNVVRESEWAERIRVAS